MTVPSLRISLVAASLAACVAAGLAAQAPVDTAAVLRTADTVAHAWLALVDKGEITKSWDEAALVFQHPLHARAVELPLRPRPLEERHDARLRVVAHRTLFRPEHLGAMGFEYPGGRLRVILSKDVRRIGASMMGEMAAILMSTQGLKREDIRYWVLHSAGRRVIDRARMLLDLSEEQVGHSRSVLRRYGNMSSATILFVLDETLRDEVPVPGDWGVMIALGPGFAAEGALLRW